MDAEIAKKSWELENSISTIDEIFKYDAAMQTQIQAQR